MSTKLLCCFLFFSLVIPVSQAQQKNTKVNAALVRELAVSKQENISLLIKGDITKINIFLREKGGRMRYSADNIAAIDIPVKEIKALSQCSFVERMEYKPNRLRTLDDSSLSRNNVLPVHAGASPLPHGYTGKGVVIGIIDTGTDFTHPDFKDSAGKSRVQYLWDQRGGATATSPQPYNYGKEWTKAQIDSGLCTHVDDISMGHGTKVAGVAAGNGMSSAACKGIAPQTDIITVAVDFNSNAPVITDGIDYIIKKATALGKPFVINISLGDYYGPHDGSDLETQLMENLMGTAPGRALVVAGGNSGEKPIHLAYTVSNTDTNFTWINAGSYYMQVYADTTNFKQVYYTLGLNNSASFAKMGNIGFRKINSCVGNLVSDTLRYNNVQYGIVQTYADLSNGLYTLEIMITTDSSDYLWNFATTGTGKFDAWGDFKHAGLPNTGTYADMTHYKRSDTLQTICGGYQCSDAFITVANYTTRDGFINATHTMSWFPGVFDSIYPTSSLGPTRDGRLKPDIAATGENITTTGSSFYMGWLLQNYPYVVTEDNLHMVFGGTSAASPVVAGFAALYLERNPNATCQMIRNDIMNCAKKDMFTGSSNSLHWGHGKLDAYHALLCSNVGINAMNSNESVYMVYPNPATADINMVSKDGSACVYTLFDALGNNCGSGRVQHNEQIKLSHLSNGIYLLRLNGDNGMQNSIRLIRQ